MYRQGLARLGALRGDQRKKEMMRKISSSFSDDQFFIMIRRRKYSTKDQCLHLCFCENLLLGPDQYDTSRDVVRSIKLSDLLSTTTTTKDEDDAVTHQIEQQAYRTYTDMLDDPFSDTIPWQWACGRLGSQILFARQLGLNKLNKVRGQILAFDATKGTFKLPKVTLLPTEHCSGFPTTELLEVDRKLYCLDTRTEQYHTATSSAFAVLVTGQRQWKWLPLESPPPGILYPHKNLMYCTVESKILVWNPDKAGVYYFDVSQPEKGWIQLHSPLATTLPFVEGCWGDTANLNHPPGILIFTYNYRPDDQMNNMISVQAFLMSHNLDSLQAMKPPLSLQLQQIIPPDTFEVGNYRDIESCLVHLGGQKVCLILHKYLYPLRGHRDSDSDSDSDYWVPYKSGAYDNTGRNKGILRLITFEYQITPDLDIHYGLLTARNFEYYTKLPNDDEESRSVFASLTKAFVI